MPLKNNMFFSLPMFNLNKKNGCQRLVVVMVFLLFFAPTFKAAAQESMIPELSYPFLEKLIFTAKQNYPRVKTFDRRVTIAQYNLKKAKLSWFEFVTLSAFYSPSTSVTLTNASLTGVQVGVFINIGSILQRPLAIQQSREELAISKLQVDEYLLTLEAEVKTRYFRYMQQLTLLKMHNQTVLDGESLMKQIRFKFEKGEETFENFNRAIVQYAEQKQRIIESEGTLLIAKTSLEELVGKKLEEIK